MSNASALSGGEAGLCDMVRHLDPRRYEASALVALEGTLTNRLRRPSRRVYCPNRDLGSATAENYDYVREVIRDVRPQVLHCNSPSGLPVMFAARAMDIPVVLHARVTQVSGWADLIEASSAIVAVSEHVRRLILRHDVPPEDVHVAYTGVDTSRFYPGAIEKAQARASLGLDDRFTIVMVARFSTNKRHDLLLHAIARLRERGRHLGVLLVGECLPGDAGTAAIERQIVELDLTDAVTFLGFQEDTRIPIAAADALVLCSEEEAFGVGVTEAMAMGVPVIVSDGNGLSEVLRPQAAGILVRQNSVEQLVDAIERLADDPAEYRRQSAAGVRAVAERLTARHTADAIMRIYDSLVHGRTVQPATSSRRAAFSACLHEGMAR